MTDDLESLLRDSLEARANSYEPRGDGLSRIRSRVTARRRRRQWLMPTLSMAAVAAAVAGVIAIPILLPDQDAVAPGPAQSNVASPTGPSASGSPGQPDGGGAGLPDMTTLWPYQSRSQAAAREPTDVRSGRLPFLADARQTALHFVNRYLGYSDPIEVIRTQPLEAGAGVVLGARNPNHALYEITTVYLVRVTRAADAPYAVVRADAPQLRISTVAPGQPGVVSVAGYVGGDHQAVQVRLVDARGVEVISGNDGAAGAIMPWRVVVGGRTNPVPAGRYAVVARTLSDANGQLNELAVRPFLNH